MAEINDALGAKEYLEEARKNFDKTMLPKMKAALKEAINALDLQVPQSPDITGDGYASGTDRIVYETWYCPNCGCSYEYPDDTHDFCPACGQAIRWPQEESS
jgi:membrane protease subunit (stomatin/prohibitin family)